MSIAYIFSFIFITKTHNTHALRSVSENMGEVRAVTDKEFDASVNDNEWVLVDFWAPWCGPCLSMAPNFAKVAEESEGLLFAKIDTQENQQISSQANIRSIPTLIFFKGGTEIDRMSGALNQSQLKQWIMQVLGKI